MAKNYKRKFKGPTKVKVKKPKSYHKTKPNRNNKFEKTHVPEQDTSDEEVSPEEDSVDQLLSTFSGNSKLRKLEAVESEDAESDFSEDEEENGDKRLPEESDGEIGPVNERNEIHDGDSIDDDGLEIADETDFGEDDLLEHDPFLLHFNGNLPPSLLSNIQSSNKQYKQQTLHWKALGEIKVTIPDQDLVKSDSPGLLNESDFVSPGQVPKQCTQIDWNNLSVKTQISRNIKFANNSNELSELQSELFVLMNNYQDMLFSHRTLENGEEVRFAYCLHAVNHILKTRIRVLHHNGRINKKDDVNMPDKFRDQGLVRPKVLILVPFRDAAHRIVNIMCRILFGTDKGNVVNKTRFNEEFTGSELFMPKTNRKPEDFEKLFSGNIDDSFRIGINFQKKSLKLYADFYSSDVIIASPLGIRMLIGADGEHDRDYDFLSSIEMLIFDQTEVFLMQNWDHVVQIMSHMHLQPKDSHGTDFSRVRLWVLNGWTRFYRQTLVFSSLLTPSLNALFSRQCTNYAGSMRITSAPTTPSISQVVISLPHVYRRFKTSSILNESDDRFTFFTDEILPQFSELHGVMIFIPSYFDFVRLRNYFKDKDLSVVQICEYTKDPKVARARDMFFHSEIRFLLYSERFHFYRRVNMKGIRHLVFYQPPTFPKFYSELCNMMQEWNQNSAVEDGNLSVTVVYSQYDSLSLAGIVRPSRAAHITSSDKAVFMFSTDVSSS